MQWKQAKALYRYLSNDIYNIFIRYLDLRVFLKNDTYLGTSLFPSTEIKYTLWRKIKTYSFLFADTLTLKLLSSDQVTGNQDVSLNGKDISWSTDRNVKFGNPTGEY